MKAQQNRLTQIQFFQLCRWVGSADLAGHYTADSLARAAPAATLGFAPIKEHVINALKATGKTLPVKPGIVANHDRTQLLAIEMVAFMREFGKEPSPILLAISRRQSIPKE